MDQFSINLLKTKSGLSGEERLILQQVWRIARGVAIITFLLGVAIATAFIVMRLRLASLEDKRTAISRSISQQARKQILLLAIHDRLPVIEKAIGTQYPWDRVIGDLSVIASPPRLKSLTVGQNTTITLRAHANTLEEVGQMVESTIALTKAKKIMKPQIVSLAVSDVGGLDISFSLVPVL
jgi:hypothetical protein